MITHLDEEVARSEPKATPDKVPNVPVEAVCGCGHLLLDHAGFWATHHRLGYEPQDCYHRGHCMEPGCGCRYWQMGEFRRKQP